MESGRFGAELIHGRKGNQQISDNPLRNKHSHPYAIVQFVSVEFVGDTLNFATKAIGRRNRPTLWADSY